MAERRLTLPSIRFVRHIARDGECLIWTGAKAKGYGMFGRGRKGTGWIAAHRFTWELLRGPIPKGLELDHLCRNHACVNPDHLEVVTHQENCLRGASPPARNALKTHCVHGHPFDKANTRFKREGRRQCRTCDRIAHRK